MSNGDWDPRKPPPGYVWSGPETEYSRHILAGAVVTDPSATLRGTLQTAMDALDCCENVAQAIEQAIYGPQPERDVRDDVERIGPGPGLATGAVVLAERTQRLHQRLAKIREAL